MRAALSQDSGGEGLPTEKIKGEGAQEGRDAVLLLQVRSDELWDTVWEGRLHHLHTVPLQDLPMRGQLEQRQ